MTLFLVTALGASQILMSELTTGSAHWSSNFALHEGAVSRAKEACLMGAWGEGVFQNDDALDLVQIVKDTPSWRPVEIALRHVVESKGYLDAPEGAMAVAAAAMVAGHFPDDSEALKRKLGPPAPSLVPLAKAALDRVVAADSELRELWGEGDGSTFFSTWLKTLDDLRQRLAEPQ